MSSELTSLALPIGLGLFGFVEPCSIGSTLVFIKLMEGRPAAAKVGQVLSFALARALFTGLLGIGAALVGSAFLGFQKAGWLIMGAVYIAIGLLYLAGRARWLMRTIGPRLGKMGDIERSAALGVFFGLSIPACAGPLLLALLASTAAGATGGGLVRGFTSLALFGFALSLPLVVAVLFKSARRGLDWLATLSSKAPRWTGVLLIALGIWSAWFGLFVSVA